MFEVGQQVVCVDDSTRDGDPTYLTCGSIYTIRSFDSECPPHVGIRIEEIILPVPPGWKEEASYYPWRFRPIRKTDISIFTAMLTKLPQNA